jgi:hypothetical protein
MKTGKLIGACLLLLVSVGGAARAQTVSVVGTWGTTLNPGTTAVIYVALAMLSNDQFTEHWMDRLGISLNLVGTYQFNPAAGTLTYTVTDYSPKAACAPGAGVGCTSVLAPQVQALIGKPVVNQVQFQTPNFMLAKGADGSVTAWTRLN